MMDAIIDMSNKRAANESRNQTLTEISDFAEKYRLGELFYASVVTWAATRITMGAAYDKKAAEAISSIEKDMVSNIDDLFPEARKITSYADFYEVETMEGLKIRISKSEIPSSIFNEIDDIANKMARETFNKNSADPFRDVLGSGLQSNPTEWNDIISKVEQARGKVRYSETGTMAYSPASQGNPGELVIDRNASLSALKHEYQHFLDDMASGWSGRRIMYEDYKERIMWELRAYMTEIKEADRLGLQNVSNQLWENYLAERYDLLSRIKPIF